MATVSGEIEGWMFEETAVPLCITWFFVCKYRDKVRVIKHNAVTAYAGMEVWLHALVTLAVEGEWVCFAPRLPLSGEVTPTPVPIEYEARWGAEHVF